MPCIKPALLRIGLTAVILAGQVGLARAETAAAPAMPEASTSAASARESDQQIGKRFQFTAAEMTEPYHGAAVRNPPLLVPRGARKPIVPPGFEVTLFAEGLQGSRQMLVLPNGDVMTSNQGGGYLMLLRDSTGSGKVDWIERHAGSFNLPYAMAYRPGEILIVDQDGVWSIGYSDGLLRPPFAEAEPASKLAPAERKAEPNMDGQRLITPKGVFGLVQGHMNKSLKIGADGRLYVGVGSVGNIGAEPSPKSTIQVFAASGGTPQTVASGMRNPCGLAVNPQTGELWAVVQERDGLGDQLVPDFITRVRPGAFYGFPYAYIGPHRQPGFADLAPDKVLQAVVPDLLLQPHSGAFSMEFYNGNAFPADFKGDAFIALHGSWNRSEPTGYKVVRVKFENGKPVGWYDNFMTGFWVSNDGRAEVWGRPSDVAMTPDGAVLVLDDTGGTIWRVTRSEKSQTSVK